MDANKLLGQMTIPNPCPMDWDAMRGDDRGRHCASCGKHVHNFTSMRPDEATAVLRAQNEELCGRVYERPDGTLVISACESGGPPPTPRPWQFHIRTFMAVVAGFATVLGFARSFAVVEGPRPTKKQTPGSARLIFGKMVP